MDERYVSSDDPDAWRGALAGIPHAFAHTVECCRAIQNTTRWSTFLYSVKTPDVQVVCPVSEREHDGHVDLVTPYQFSGFTGTGDWPGFQDCWQRFARSRGAVAGYHALHPGFATEGYYDKQECVVENNLYVVDLTPSVEELLGRFDRSRRRALRGYATAFEGLIVDREVLTAFLIETYPSFVARVQASVANRFNASTLGALGSLQNVEFVGAGTAGRVEAVYLFGFTPFAGDCLLNVATLDGRRHSTMLLWYGMLALKARGVPLLNLGGGVRPGDSVALAKQRFRAECVPFRSVRQVYRPDIYEQLCRRAGADSRNRHGYFPAYRTPQTQSGPPR